MVTARLDDRLTARVDPSDVVQDTLVLASRHLTDYLSDPALPFYPWLRQIAWNRLDALRRQHIGASKRSIEQERPWGISGSSTAQLADHLASRESGPLRRVMREEMRSRVRAALAKLADPDREILVLRHVEQLSYADSAAVLGISETAARQRHVRALRRMRGLLDEHASGP
jgi:RNA polymerase sigma-70 factor (ECF subfamily)